MVKPFGPNQRSRCSALVQALKTSSRGASKVRSRTMVRADSATGLVGVMLLSLSFSLKLVQVFVETVEALLPELPVVVEPIGDVLERRDFETAGTPLRLPPLSDQPGVLQHLQVLRYG